METEFIQIVNAYAGLLYNVCKLYSRDEDDRKDLYQEIVLQLWRAFPNYRREAQRSTWMYRIALNTAISLFRRESRQPARGSFSDELLNIPQPAASPDVEERMQQFYTAVEQLSSVEKALVFLYMDNKSYDEIAGVMGISPSNVGVKLNRIKGKLRKMVELTDQ